MEGGGMTLQDLQKQAKQYIDANIWDGEDRAGAKGDSASFNPDTLQELVDDMLEFMSEEGYLREVKQDAARYRKLRIKNWSERGIAVVAKSDSIKLGHECLSNERLDAALDAEKGP